MFRSYSGQELTSWMVSGEDTVACSESTMLPTLKWRQMNTSQQDSVVTRESSPAVSTPDCKTIDIAAIGLEEKPDNQTLVYG